jgi:hypothetical protein
MVVLESYLRDYQKRLCEPSFIRQAGVHVDELTMFAYGYESKNCRRESQLRQMGQVGACIDVGSKVEDRPSLLRHQKQTLARP